MSVESITSDHVFMFYYLCIIINYIHYMFNRRFSWIQIMYLCIFCILKIAFSVYIMVLKVLKVKSLIYNICIMKMNIFILFYGIIFGASSNNIK